ncbi:MAG: hypothetical protein ACQKBW_06270, partial [Puniceicoccales bacterium]
MESSNTIPADLAWLIQRELNLNQEVILLRTENAERREKLRKMLEAETAADKIGLTRMPFSMKKLPSEVLRDKVTEMANEIRDKVRQWQELKRDIEKKIEGYLLDSNEEFVKACQAFGIIAESRAILVNLRNRVTDYLSRTGQVRGSMAAGYNTATQTFSKQALEALRGTIESAYAADGIILKIQERETQFARLVDGTFAAHITLPEFYTMSLGDFTESLRNMPLEAGVQGVTKAVQHCDTLLREALPNYEK